MSLLPGTRLGPYEILAPLGAGGMGGACHLNVVVNWQEELKQRVPTSD